jgi:biopolymer transport protein ExbB/TolQ
MRYEPFCYVSLIFFLVLTFFLLFGLCIFRVARVQEKIWSALNQLRELERELAQAECDLSRERATDSALLLRLCYVRNFLDDEVRQLNEIRAERESVKQKLDERSARSRKGFFSLFCVLFFLGVGLVSMFVHSMFCNY